MKKVIFLISLLLMLTACGKGNDGDNLQSKKWNVVATNGEAYTAEFGEDTVSFKMGGFTKGFTYEINEGEIILKEDGKESIVFDIEKNGDEYKFKATTETIKDKFGDLTLSPVKE
ncbi:hypothetical protein HRF69_20775 [Bacillus circulans]|jgi:hypothetical protein|uniref:lipoprotein n=1 Tax=Niallia circulans TaxID=1397 RepID=UPI0015613149|nr:lipoprotein [Niallia circulans]NRG29536.1 hypothetical protein [Niallia circulans]